MDTMDSVKLLVVGDELVGKTSFVHRFVNEEFLVNTATSDCMKFSYRRLNMGDDKELMVNVYDAPSAEVTKRLTSLYYKSVQGVVILYDDSSVAGLSKWLNEIQEGILPDTVILLVRNKVDAMESRNNDYTVEKMAARHAVDVMDVSSSTGENVEVAVRLLITKIEERRRTLREETRPTMKKATFSHHKHKNNIFKRILRRLFY